MEINKQREDKPHYVLNSFINKRQILNIWGIHLKLWSYLAEHFTCFPSGQAKSIMSDALNPLIAGPVEKELCRCCWIYQLFLCFEECQFQFYICNFLYFPYEGNCFMIWLNEFFCSVFDLPFHKSKQALDWHVIYYFKIWREEDVFTDHAVLSCGFTFR